MNAALSWGPQCRAGWWLLGVSGPSLRFGGWWRVLPRVRGGGGVGCGRGGALVVPSRGRVRSRWRGSRRVRVRGRMNSASLYPAVPSRVMTTAWVGPIPTASNAKPAWGGALRLGHSDPPRATALPRSAGPTIRGAAAQSTYLDRCRESQFCELLAELVSTGGGVGSPPLGVV